MKKKLFKYRPDIDGLRAIAVLAVVFFHLDYSIFSGGFVGVDVFFVISGFLISQIVVNKTNNNNFSFTTFYKKRILRILPVLFVLIIFSLFFGYFVLLADEYSNLGASSISSVFFVPNVYYWFNTGYFEIEAESTPLLHLWSLGVEEQFYIFFPLLAFLLITRFRKSNVFLIVLLLMVISFTTNVIYTTLDITFSFYMIFTRAWELMAGFLITLLLQHTHSLNKFFTEVLAAIGLLLILASVYFYNTKILFPGYFALLPVVGSMLIIFSGSFDYTTTVKRILSSKLLVYIGLISYSLYLWHWPILVYFRMAFSFTYLNETILAVSVFLSILSYLLIEQPFRDRGGIKVKLRTKYSSLIVMAIVILSTSLYLIHTAGAPQRLPSEVHSISNSKQFLPENRHCHRMKNKDVQARKFCTFGDERSIPSFALIGDSHAEAVKYGLKLAAISKGKSGVQYTKPGCRPIKGIDKKGRKACLNFINTAIDDVINNNQIETVFLAGYWALAYHGFDHNRRKFEMFDHEESHSSSKEVSVLFLKGLHRTINILLKANKKIVVLGDTPVLGFNPRTTFARNVLFNITQDIVATPKPGVDNIIKEELKPYGNKVQFLSTEKIICPNNPCKLVKNNQLLFRNDDHISREAAALITPKFESYL